MKSVIPYPQSYTRAPFLIHRSFCCCCCGLWLQDCGYGITDFINLTDFAALGGGDAVKALSLVSACYHAVMATFDPKLLGQTIFWISP